MTDNENNEEIKGEQGARLEKEEIREEEMEEEETEGEETDEDEEEDAGLPFPTAPIVRIMRKNLDSDKMIRSEVKKAMNEWLGDICSKVTRRMNQSDYTMVSMIDFKNAIEPYENVVDIDIERERIIASMEKIKADCDSLKRDVERKFRFE